MKKFVLFFLYLLFYCSAGWATHLKGGKISYERITGFTYRFILTVYTERSGGIGGIIDFGDGHSQNISNTEPRAETPLGNNTTKVSIEFVHTYASGGSYQIGYQELYRNLGVLNMENSGNMPFYIDASIVVDSYLLNNSVVLREDPVHIAYLNQTYHYNPKAYDADGDSLSFHLVPPKQGKEVEVSGYTYPHQAFSREGASETGENAYLSFNRLTGDLVWDAPVRTGEYHIAFEVREWRKIEDEYFLVGRIVQDMQVIVKPVQDMGLELVFPGESQDIYLEADNPWETTIRAIADNPEDTVVLKLSGSFLLQSPQIAPSDSVWGKGEVEIQLSHSSPATEAMRSQLIATASLYSEEEGAGSYRSRAVYLLAPGYISGFSDLPVRSINIFPNPVKDGWFKLDYPLLNGKEVKVSLFSADGKKVFQKSISSFSHEEPIRLDKSLIGFYMVLIQQGGHFYTSRVMFSL